MASALDCTLGGPGSRPGPGTVLCSWALDTLLSSLDEVLVHHRVTPTIILLIPIYTPGWREAL